VNCVNATPLPGEDDRLVHRGTGRKSFAEMTRTLAGFVLTLCALALSGCGSAPSRPDYSSLPAPPPRSAETAPAPAPVPPAIDVTPATVAGSDVLDRIRAGFALSDVDHRAVDRELDLYLSQPEYLDRIFQRGARYLHYIVGEIDKRGMPMELALLPIVESAFNPVAYSRSRASGLWQFIPSTGKHFGLQQTWWLDERRDVIKSTEAALTYLQYLSEYFNGDWFLAIAAYNGGEGNVSRAVQRNAAAGRHTDFFSLDLRAETRNYVPKLLAIRRLVANPRAYGLEFAPIPDEPFFEIVDPGRQVHLGQAATAAGLSRDDLFALNPAYNRMMTPPHGPHRLLLPVANAGQLRVALAADPMATAFASNDASEPVTTESHVVRRGDTLSTISRRYGVSVAALREANGLNSSTIHPGQSILIPASLVAGVGPSAESRGDITNLLPERQALTRARSHRVRSGDTLWGIARRYGVTVPELAAVNNLSTQAPLRAGMKLKIPSGSERPVATAQGTRTTYKVRSGDTLSQIAERFNVTVRELMTWNRLRTSSSLRAGQRLVVYADASRLSGG
jgi:membrane-bound lytic murein transglycosylase D